MDSIIIKASVYFNSKKAGSLWKSEEIYYFQYDSEYLSDNQAVAISFSLPLESNMYKSENLFPFFEGLVSEGWLLSQQSINQKIDEDDYFTLLLENGRDLVGAVTIVRDFI